MRLSEQQIAAELETLEWDRRGDEILREWKLAGFRAAIAFVNEIAGLADAASHHPDILVHGYNRVRVTLTTHSVEGLTALDFELARQIDALR
jgi:4a-hydroxytetrahydrobiopterin dehydratase